MEITAWRFSRSWGGLCCSFMATWFPPVLQQKHIYREYVGLDACAA